MFQAGRTTFTCKDISRAFSESGHPPPNALRSHLSRLCRGKTATILRNKPKGYALSVFGQKEVQDYMGATSVFPAKESALAALVGKIAGDAEQRFLAEAVACVDVRARRAAVVMIWAMTVDHLERYALNHELAAFNTAWAKRTDCKGRTIRVQDDFLEIRDERTFLEILRSGSIITKDVWKILDEKLGFRNTCAHPNDIVVPDSKVLSAIEDLVYNVILKYPL